MLYSALANSSYVMDFLNSSFSLNSSYPLYPETCSLVDVRFLDSSHLLNNSHSSNNDSLCIQVNN